LKVRENFGSIVDVESVNYRFLSCKWEISDNYGTKKGCFRKSISVLMFLMKGIKMSKQAITVWILIVSLLSLSVIASGDTYYVDPNGDDDANGLTLQTPFKTINHAFDTVVAGDTIYLREGVYREALEFGRDSERNYYSKGASANSRITIVGYQDEIAVITSMKLADDTNNWKFAAIGSNLVANGDFTNWSDGDPCDWTVSVGGSSEITEVGTGEAHGGIGSGSCNIYSPIGALARIDQTVYITNGKSYRATIEVSEVNEGMIKFRINRTNHTISTTGTHEFDFEATAGSTTLLVERTGTANITFDNISVYELSDTVYSFDLEKPTVYPHVNKITNCSEDGVPLKLMTAYDISGEPNDLIGPGQWARSSDNWKLYVWSTDGNNPGTHKTEYANFTHAYNSVNNTIHFHYNSANDVNEVDYITLDNLTIEGGYFAITVGSDYIEIKNCTIRNCYADAIKTPADLNDSFEATNGKIENCDISLFGENGIDATGADNWIICDNNIHDSVSNRGDRTSGNKVNAIVLKYGIKDTTVERNEIYNLTCDFGIIICGGNSSRNPVLDFAEDTIVKNNIIYDCNAKEAAQFINTRNCGFYNNLVYGCDFSVAIFQANLGLNDPNTINQNLRIKNNIIYNNTVEYYDNPNRHWIFREYQSGSIDDDFEMNYNLIDTSQDYSVEYSFDGNTLSLAQVRQLGYETYSITEVPTFVDSDSYDFHYLLSSPQVDAGDPNEPTDANDFNPYDSNEVDFDGLGRVYDGDGNGNDVVDMGPYEYGPLVWNTTQDSIYSEIQTAVNGASSGDTIVVYPWIYYETVTYPSSKQITIEGADLDNWSVIEDTIIDANDATNGVYFGTAVNDNSELKGLTIRNATYVIRYYASSPTVSRCIITDSSSHCVYATSSSSAPTVKNCKIFNNASSGITINQGTATIKNNWIYDNAKGINFYDLASNVLVQNNTIVDNTLYGVKVSSGTVDPNILNCIIWNNSDDIYDCNAIYSCIKNGDMGTGNISSDPCFVDVGANDFHLDPNSLCIDVADANGTYIGEIDIDFMTRVLDGDNDGNDVIDMGADEYGPSS